MPPLLLRVKSYRQRLFCVMCFHLACDVSLNRIHGPFLVQVDIYMVLGPQFEAYLGELNASQLRLVRIYINRMNKARNERAAGAPGLAQPNAQAES